MKQKRDWTWTAALLVGGSIGMPGVAKADVTIVTDIVTTGDFPARQGRRPPPPRDDQGEPVPPREGEDPGRRQPGSQSLTMHRTLKVYYHGKKARSESEGMGIVLYDGSTGKVYRLDPQRKIYAVQSLKEALQEPPMPPIPPVTIGTGNR